MLINAKSLGQTGAITIELDGKVTSSVVDLDTISKKAVCYRRDENGLFIQKGVNLGMEVDFVPFEKAVVKFDNVTIKVD